MPQRSSRETELEDDLDAWVAYAGKLERENAELDEENRAYQVELAEMRWIMAGYRRWHFGSLAAPTPPATDDARA